MGSLRGRVDRHKQDFPETPGVVYCYDVLIVKSHCADGLGILAYRLGEPVGFRISKGYLVEIVSLKVLPKSIDRVLREELEDEDVEHWLLDPKEVPYTFKNMQMREPKYYDNLPLSCEEITYTMTVGYENSHFFVAIEPEPRPTVKIAEYPWEI